MDVLHLLPADLARGAQRRAVAIRRALDGSMGTHRTLAIFEVPDAAGAVDFDLGASALQRRLLVSPVVLSRLNRALRLLRPKVVAAYGSEALRYAVLARDRGIPVVYSRTGIFAGRPGRARLAFHRWLAQRADLVAAVSSDTALEVETLLGVAPDRVVVVSNGRDPELFHPSTSSGPGTTVRLLWMGRLVPGKRAEHFLKVVRHCDEKNLDVAGTIVGGGPLLPLVRADAACLPIDVMGERGDVAPFLRDAHLFVFTGDRGGEGLPGVLIEAALAGLPIVTTDVPGARDVVIDGLNGLVVEEGDVRALQLSVERLVSSPDLRSEMGRAGRLHALANFSIDATAARWVQALARFAVTGPSEGD